MSSPPPNPPPDRPDANTGDSVHVNVGEEAQHVAAGKNIIQIGSLSIPRWAALLIVAAYAPTPTATATPVPTLTPTPRPFPPVSDGETLLVILPFHNTAATNTEVHKEIWRKIKDLLAKLPNQSVTAELDPNAVFTADQQEEAESIGKLYIRHARFARTTCLSGPVYCGADVLSKW